MQYNMTIKQITNEISFYHSPNWIWIEIWEISPYEIQLVVTINEEQSCHLGQHKVIHVCTAATDMPNDIAELKAYGRKIRRKLKRNFPTSNIRSNLRY